MIRPIYNDLFKLSRYLPNQLGVVVKFYGLGVGQKLIVDLVEPREKKLE
jgi:hypothetical protein